MKLMFLNFSGDFCSYCVLFAFIQGFLHVGFGFPPDACIVFKLNVKNKNININWFLCGEVGSIATSQTPSGSPFWFRNSGSCLCDVSVHVLSVFMWVSSQLPKTCRCIDVAALNCV